MCSQLCNADGKGLLSKLVLVISCSRLLQALDATPIPINFEQELSVDNEKTVLTKAKEDGTPIMIAATRFCEETKKGIF